MTREETSCFWHYAFQFLNEILNASRKVPRKVKSDDTRRCHRKFDCRVKKLVNRTVWGDLLFPACRSRTLRLRQRSFRDTKRRRPTFIFDAGDDHEDGRPEYRLWEALMRHVNILTLIRSPINENTKRRRYNYGHVLHL